MFDTDWVVKDLRILRDRFREARLKFPGLCSKLAQLPVDERIWHVQEWERVGSFASIREYCNLISNESQPAVNFFFFRPAAACLTRSMGAGWDLVPAAACFGQLAMMTVATLHLRKDLQALANQFWWQRDERAWIAWLHKSAGTWGAEELELEWYSVPYEAEDDGPHDEKLKVDVSYVDDVFESSCRVVDQIIDVLEHADNPPSIGEGSEPNAAGLVVGLTPPQIKFGNTVYSVTPDAALFVQALVNAKGDWIAGSKLDMRADRVKAALPQPIRELIESAPGKG
jgi:hypothetical protein